MDKLHIPNDNFDVIVVLGGGIDSKGAIPGFVKARITMALNISDYKIPIIFTGKWSFLINYSPPVSEAQAMKNFAISVRPNYDDSLFIVEDESRDTIGNAYFTKVKVLVPNNWNKIALITSDFHIDRSLYIFQKVLGTNYSISPIITKSGFSGEQLQIKIKTEKKLLRFTKDILIPVKKGNDRTVYKILQLFPGYSDKPKFHQSMLLKFIESETKHVNAYGLKVK